jgi:sterol desaturase/sphingolipid hydroxylase (fatty acid hydroxylase superfamily)
MHIWHHAKDLPPKHPHGMNFGISLSIWDYIFGTAYVPHSGKDIPLGFEDIEKYPETFLGQMKEPFTKK